MELPPLEQLRESRTEMEELGLSLVPNPSPWLEIRLFYVRISPCCVDLAPEQLCLRTLPRPIGALLEINGVRIPPSDSAALSLRRDRLDRGAAEVTYVSTDGVRIAGELGLEVLDSNDDLILCGSLERVEAQWGKMETPRLEEDGRTGWSMDCYSAVASPRSASPFLRGASTTPSIEVYLAGCCSGFPLILAKTIPLASRKKVVRQGALESIPEDEEAGAQQTGSIALLRRRALQACFSLSHHFRLFAF